MFVGAGISRLASTERWSTEWQRSFESALVTERVTEGVSELSNAPVDPQLPASVAARRVAEHLADPVAQRRRHDAAVRVVAAFCREKGRVRVDTPLALLCDPPAVKGKSRKVDVVLEVDDAVKAFIEITVITGKLSRAIAEKDRKYADLEIKPIVLAIHAVTGDVQPTESFARLAQLGFDQGKLAELQAALRATLLALAAAPLQRPFDSSRRDTPLHVRRRRRRPSVR